MPIDLDSTEEIFASSHGPDGRPRGGVRDPRPADARPRPALRGAARRRRRARPGAGRVDRRRAHLHRDRDPLGPRGGPPRRAGTPARGAARAVRARRGRGVALGATGTHPWADYREQPQHRHRALPARRRWPAATSPARNNTFSLHVHVGVRDADRAVLACDRLRPVLPLLLAVSANSPFLEGRDTRPALRPQPVVHEVLPALRRARRLRELAGLPRLHRAADPRRTRSSSTRRSGGRCARTRRSGPSRCASATRRSTLAESEAPGAADRRLRRSGCARHRRGRRVRGSGAPARRGERVARHPLRHGRADDRPRRAAARSRTRAALEQLWTWTAPARAELRIDPALDGPNGAQRQRAALAEAGDLREVYAATVRETDDDLRPGGAAHEHRSRRHAAARGRPLRPTEEELRAAYEAELARIRVEDVLVQTVVSLLNLGARKAGLRAPTRSPSGPGRPGDRRVRALLPFVEPTLGPEAAPGARRALAAAARLRAVGRRPPAAAKPGGGRAGGRGDRSGAVQQPPLGAGPVASATAGATPAVRRVRRRPGTLARRYSRGRGPLLRCTRGQRGCPTPKTSGGRFP